MEDRPRALMAVRQTAELARRVAARYRRRATRCFVHAKLWADPVLAAVLDASPLGSVLDLGCGRGQLAVALLLAGQADSVIGLDLDADKIALAAEAAAGLPVRFAVADIATTTIPPADTALLIDVLSQMPPVVQHALLARIAAAGPTRIVIRAPDPDRGWRSAAWMAAEHLRRWLGADLGRRGQVAPLSPRDLAAPLESAGYRVTVTPCWAGTPLPNVLILAERP